MENDFLIPDPLSFDAEAAKLARRRRVAEALIKTPINGMAGESGIRAMSGADPGAFLSRAAGRIDSDRLDSQEKLLAGQETAERDRFMAGIPGSNGTPESDKARLAYLGRGMAIPSIRKMLEVQIGQEFDVPAKRAELEAARLEKSEQAAADRVLKSEEGELNRQNRLDARAVPTIHITNSGNTGAGGFGGAAPQIGAVPEGKEGAGNPIYRHTKSGQLFHYDESGNPVAYEGAIAPKPVNDAASRKAVHEANLGMTNIDGALDLLTKHGDATGSLYKIPGMEWAGQFFDPSGVLTRAAVANIGSQKLHDRSGAAVTIGEMPRLAPFIPSVGDRPSAAAEKLKGLKAEYARMQAEWSGKVAAPTVVRTGKDATGRKVQQMSDGSVRYAD